MPAKDSAQQYRIDASGLPPEEVIFGSTPAMRTVREKIDRTSDTDLPMLICGETGTGKEVVARYAHLRSLRRDGPYVKVNCAAIPAHLLESELLGFERGAFTGANDSKPGLIEQAEGGTLFLDEIGEMDASLQAKLLHLLQDGRYWRLGGGSERMANVRIFCATHCDLEALVESGRFRSDLFYRIEVISIRLPALRERRQDIPLLCNYLRERYSSRLGRAIEPLSEMTLHLISQWPWAGNIRELENWTMREIVLGVHEALSTELQRRYVEAGVTAGAVAPGQLKQASRDAARAAEHALILKHLDANQWNRRKASKSLNISYRSLMYKLREAGIPSTRGKQKPA